MSEKKETFFTKKRNEMPKKMFPKYMLTTLLYWITWKQETAKKYKSSDILLQVGEYPKVYQKDNGWWISIVDAFKIDDELMESFFAYVTPEKVKNDLVLKETQTWSKTLDADFATSLNKNLHYNKDTAEEEWQIPLICSEQSDHSTVSRFRINLFKTKWKKSFVFRTIPSEIPDFHAFWMEEIMLQFVDVEKWMLFITWPTGSWKSTTMAAIVNEMNKKKRHHIVSLEDPVEFTFPNINCVFSQREVWMDTDSFARWLKSALREHPNVIIIWEMRDVETISWAIEAAETWHLVIATLHTFNAAKTVDRIVSAFPTDEQNLIATKLSSVFVWAISQMLAPKIGGWVVALNECIRVNGAIQTNIKEMKSEAIWPAADADPNSMTMVDHCLRLIKEGKIEQRFVLEMFSREDEDSYDLMKVKLKRDQLYFEHDDPREYDEKQYEDYLREKERDKNEGVSDFNISND